MNRTNRERKKSDVIGVGSCALDLLGIVPSFPKSDTKNKMVRFIQQQGGPIGTALVTLARLGVMSPVLSNIYYTFIIFWISGLKERLKAS